MAKDSMIGKENVLLGATALYRSALKDAPSELAGQEASRAVDVVPHRRWRPATSDPTNTRLLVRLPRSHQVGAGSILGAHGTTDAAAARVVKDERWSERAIATSDLDTADAITEPQSWTLRVTFRVPKNVTSGKIVEVQKGASSNNSTRLGRIRMTSARTAGLSIARLSGSNVGADGAAPRIDDGKLHCCDLVFAGTPTDGVATLYTDGTQVVQAAIPSAFGSNTGLRVQASGVFQICSISFFNVALSTAVLDAMRWEILKGDERSSVAILEYLEGAGITVADATGNGNTGTLAAATWSTAVNPVARHDSKSVPIIHQWRRRAYIRQQLPAAVGNTVESGLTIGATAETSVLFWFRRREVVLSAGLDRLVEFENASASHDWKLTVLNGLLRFEVSRFSASNVVALSLGNVEDGAWHWVLARVGDYLSTGPAADLYLDGVLQDTVACDPYTAEPAARLRIGTGDCGYDISGPLVVWSRLVGVDEAKEVAHGRQVPTPHNSFDPRLQLWYPMLEGAGTTVANRSTLGSSADLTIGAAGYTWRERTSEDPDGVWRPGSVFRIRNFHELLQGDPVACQEVLFQIIDPAAAAGAISVGILAAWEVLLPDPGAEEAELSLEGPGLERSVERYPFRSVGADGVTASIVLDQFSDQLAAELFEALEERGHVRPVLLVARRSVNRALRYLWTVYGTPERELTRTRRRVLAKPHGRRIVVKEVPT